MDNASNLELFQTIEAGRRFMLFPMITVYDHPRDYPEGFVGRLFLSWVGGSTATTITATSPNLEDLEERLEEVGLTKMTPQAGDDPKICGVWL